MNFEPQPEIEAFRREQSSMRGSPPTVAEAIHRNAIDTAICDRPFVKFEDSTVSHRDFYAESVRFAKLFLELRRQNEPFHVGVLLDNLPEYLFALGGAAIAGAVLVGVNNVQRGDFLLRDIHHTDCQLLLTEPQYVA